MKNSAKINQIEPNSVLSLLIPTSKSITNRVLLIAALSDGVCTIKNPLISDDTSVMLEALSNLGINIEKNNNHYLIHGRSGKFNSPSSHLNLNNAGTAVRFLAVAANLCEHEVIITGNERMQQRPISDLVDALNSTNQNIKYVGGEGYPPLKINNSGQLNGGIIEISGKVSSQYISALLISAPCSIRPTTIKIKDELVSKPYIDLTLQIMSDFGIKVKNNNYREFKVPQKKYQAREYEIEADASSASYFYGIAAINNSTITVLNANPNSLQGDTAILEILEKMGCTVTKKNGITVKGPKKLRPLGKIDLNHMPDAAMTVAVIAACAKGKSELKNIENLRVKETDRLKALATELSKVNCDAKETKTGLIINGNPPKLEGNTINTYDDHRMAMCFAMLGTKIKGMTIKDPECTSKTYPNFWENLEFLNANSATSYIKKTLKGLNKEIITISGMRGCGKSNNGRGISKLLGWKLIDLDDYIEAKDERKIAEIVKKDGWPYFRKLETKSLKEVLKQKKVVISLGGGTIIDDENYNCLKDKSVIIFLYCEIKAIAERIKNSKNRPSLTNNQDFITELETVWQERKEKYLSRHDFKIDTSKWLPKSKLETRHLKIITKLANYLKKYESN